jgi:3'-5' exonuclease
MKAVIESVNFVREWGESFKKVFYHDVTLKGIEGTWNIGAKKEYPDYLKAGKTLEYEVTDAEKFKIKRLSDQFANKTSGAGPATANKPTYKKVKEVIDDPHGALIRVLNSTNEADIVFIDIETAPIVKELKPNTQLHEAWAYKARYDNEFARKTGGAEITIERLFHDKATLYAPFARIVAIVAGRIVDDKLSVKRYLPSKKHQWSEEPMLREFNDDIQKMLDKNPNTVFGGWANKTFDQPFLSKRMLVHKIRQNILLDTAHLKPWEIPGVDLKELWQGTSFYPDSLIAAAYALGLPSPKAKMDGSQVGEAFYAGKIEEIGDYCVDDVLTEVNVYRLMMGKEPVELK